MDSLVQQGKGQQTAPAALKKARAILEMVLVAQEMPLVVQQMRLVVQETVQGTVHLGRWVHLGTHPVAVPTAAVLEVHHLESM